MNPEIILVFLEDLGLPIGNLSQLVLVMPLLLFIASLLVYFFSMRARKSASSKEQIARAILNGSRGRSTGMSPDEMRRRLMIDQEQKSGVGASFLKVAEILLRLVNFDKVACRKKLIQSGDRDPRALSRYIVQRGLGMLIAPGVLYFLMGQMGFQGILQIVTAIMGILVGGIIVDVRLDKAVASRKSRVHSELPVLLDLLTIYMESGAAFDIALARASHALRISFPTAASEIYFLRRDLEMSVERERTLREFGERMATQTAKTFVAIVVQSERRGNAIAPSLRRLARDARLEVISEIEKKAQKIPTVMQLPMFLFILPAIFMSVIGPAVVQVVKQVGGQ